jgi:serine protease Do
MMQPGQTVKLTINRSGSTKDIDVKLGELPLSKAEAEANDSENGSSKESMKGITVETLDSDTAQQLQLPEATKGVVVTGVDPSSAAADSGLRKGDVIQEVNHQPVKNAAEFEAAMSKSEKNGALLLVNRGGTTVFVAL